MLISLHIYYSDPLLQIDVLIDKLKHTCLFLYLLSCSPIAAHDSIVTVALLAPRSTIRFGCSSDEQASSVAHLIVTAGYDSEIKIFENRGVPRTV